jgi:hypothetical protein
MNKDTDPKTPSSIDFNSTRTACYAQNQKGSTFLNHFQPTSTGKENSRHP